MIPWLTQADSPVPVPLDRCERPASLPESAPLTESGLAGGWYGKLNREAQPVLDPREPATRLGLLRRYHGTLLVAGPAAPCSLAPPSAPGPHKATAAVAFSIQIFPNVPWRLSHPTTPPGPAANSSAEAHQRLTRLAALDTDRMTMALTWLAGYSPTMFDATLDATEPCTDDDNPDPADNPEPFCMLCGADVGIFLRFGLDRRHYRGDGTTVGLIELSTPATPPSSAGARRNTVS